MTSPVVTFAVRRLSLALLIGASFILAGGTAFADPPPYPYFSVINQTEWTLAGTFEVEYIPLGGATPKRVTLEGSMAPRQSLRRNLPDRIDHIGPTQKARVNHAGLVSCALTRNGTRFQVMGGTNGCNTAGSLNINFAGGTLNLTTVVWPEHTSGDPEHITLYIAFQ